MTPFSDSLSYLDLMSHRNKAANLPIPASVTENDRQNLHLLKRLLNAPPTLYVAFAFIAISHTMSFSAALQFKPLTGSLTSTA